MNDYTDQLEKEIKDLNLLISYCKENNLSNSLIFTLTALSVKKKDKLLKLIK